MAIEPESRERPMHTSIRRRRLLQSSLVGIDSSILGIARAAAWPTRSLGIVIPFPPGGTADVTARLLADKLAAALGQTVIVEARPGANGIIASDAVAKSTSDGHTLVLANASHASNASLYPRLPYDSTRDFAPVALVAPPGRWSVTSTRRCRCAPCVTCSTWHASSPVPWPTVLPAPGLCDKLKLLGSDEVPTLSPEGFGSFMAAETTRYARVIKAAGIQLETSP